MKLKMIFTIVTLSLLAIGEGNAAATVDVECKKNTWNGTVSQGTLYNEPSSTLAQLRKDCAQKPNLSKMYRFFSTTYLQS